MNGTHKTTRSCSKLTLNLKLDSQFGHMVVTCGSDGTRGRGKTCTRARPGTSQGHTVGGKTRIDKRRQGKIRFRVYPAFRSHPCSGSKRATLSTISILDPSRTIDTVLSAMTALRRADLDAAASRSYRGSGLRLASASPHFLEHLYPSLDSGMQYCPCSSP